MELTSEKKQRRKTNPGEEKAKGRIAVWLDPKDLAWLTKHCCCTDTSSPEDRERCLRFRYKSGAALYQEGLEDLYENDVKVKTAL